MSDGQITRVVSQAQAHLLGLVIAGRKTLPNVDADQARALLTGVAVHELPPYSGNTPFSPAAALSAAGEQPAPLPATLQETTRRPSIATSIIIAATLARRPKPSPSHGDNNTPTRLAPPDGQQIQPPPHQHRHQRKGRSDTHTARGRS